MLKRETTRKVKVGSLQIGQQNRVIMQSMTNTKTKDVEATIRQINALKEAGCEIVRMAILDNEDAEAVGRIKEQIKDVPLVADIHFNYRFGIICAENGIDKIRINPGNIGSKDNVRKITDICKVKGIPIRIGINSGSLEKEYLEKYGGPCVDAMMESAKKHISMLTENHFEDIVLSFKSSNVPLTIAAYQKASEIFPYPLHLGVTEAGTFNESAIKSSAALGTLLSQGIGDTIRVSVSADPVDEMIICKKLLKCFDLIDNVPDLISCPTCGRIQYDMLPIADKVEKYLNTLHSNITVAVMGCPVNGPQEASRADIGIAGGRNEGMLFKKGQFVRTVKQEDMFDELVKEINAFVKEEENHGK